MAESTSKITYLLEAAQATTEATKLSGSLDGIGKAAQTGAAQATAALNQVEVAAKLGRADLALLDTMYKNVVASQGATSVAAQQLAAELRAQGVAVEGATTVLQEKVVVNQAVTVSALEAARAEQALALAEVEEGVTSELSAQHAIRLAGAFGHVTDMAIPNVRALGHIAGGLSTMAFGQLAVIAGLGLLVGWLIESFKEKEKQIALDKEQIALDFQRHEALRTGTLFTSEYARVLRDKNAVDEQLKKTGEELLIAQANENDAVRKSSTAYHEAAASTDNLQNKIATYVVGLFHSVETQTQATATRLEATKKMEEEITARIKLAAETGQTAAALIAERIAAGATTAEIERLTGALNAGALAQAEYRRGQGIVGEIRERVAWKAAEAGETLKHAEAIRRERAEFNQLSDSDKHLSETAELAKRNAKAFNDEHVRGAGAARSRALAENSLTRALLDAQAALIGDNFAARTQKIENDIAAERNALRIKHQLNQVAVGQLIDLEKYKLEKVNQDRAQAEIVFQDKLRQMQIAGIVDEYARKQAEIDFKVEKEAEALIKEFGISKDTTDKIMAYRRRAEDEMARFRIEKALTLNEYLGGIASDLMKQEGRGFEKDIDAMMKYKVDAFKKSEAEIDSLTKHFAGGSQFNVGIKAPDVVQITNLIARMKEIGVSTDMAGRVFGNFSKNVNVAEKQVEVFATKGLKDLALAMNADSKQSQQFTDQLHRLQAIASGNSIGLLKANLDEAAHSFEFVNGIAQEFGHSLASAFEQIIAGGFNFIQFITTMVASVITQLGSILIAKGISDILQATATLADPFMAWAWPMAAVQLGAGHAELAQGLIFEAIGGVVSGLGALAGGKGGAAGGGGAAATSGSTAQQPSPAHPPIITPFPTSGSQPGAIRISLDRNLTKDLINGEEVVTVPMMGKVTSRTPLGKHIKKLARST